MNKVSKRLIKLIVFLSLLFSIVSCLDKEIEDIDQQQQQLVDDYINGKGYTNIGYGIYLKFYNREGIAPQEDNVETGDAFIVNYDGVFTNEELWETTDSAKGDEFLPGRYWIYGPMRFRSGDITMFGFDTAIKYFSKGDSGSIVIPASQGWGDYPRVFHVGMKEVIKNDTLYERERFLNYLTENNYKETDTIYSGVFWKHPTDPSFKLSDSSIYVTPPTLKIKLIAKYAETYYNSGEGRTFYPILTDSIERTRNVGESSDYPFIPAVDSALYRMKDGDIIDFIGESRVIGWGDKGYYQPNLKITLVPEYMPLHYRIEVIEGDTLSLK